MERIKLKELARKSFSELPRNMAIDILGEDKYLNFAVTKTLKPFIGIPNTEENKKKIIAALFYEFSDTDYSLFCNDIDIDLEHGTAKIYFGSTRRPLNG